MQKIEAEMAPKLSAHSDAIYLDPTLFARVEALYEQRDTLGLDRRDRCSCSSATTRTSCAPARKLSDADKTQRSRR